MKMAFDKSNLLFVLMTVATVKVWEFTSLWRVGKKFCEEAQNYKENVSDENDDKTPICTVIQHSKNNRKLMDTLSSAAHFIKWSGDVL